MQKNRRLLIKRRFLLYSRLQTLQLPSTKTMACEAQALRACRAFVKSIQVRTELRPIKERVSLYYTELLPKCRRAAMQTRFWCYRKRGSLCPLFVWGIQEQRTKKQGQIGLPLLLLLSVTALSLLIPPRIRIYYFVSCANYRRNNCDPHNCPHESKNAGN